MLLKNPPSSAVWWHASGMVQFGEVTEATLAQRASIQIDGVTRTTTSRNPRRTSNRFPA